MGRPPWIFSPTNQRKSKNRTLFLSMGAVSRRLCGEIASPRLRALRAVVAKLRNGAEPVIFYRRIAQNLKRLRIFWLAPPGFRRFI
jgi:hypothetical protein